MKDTNSTLESKHGKIYRKVEDTFFLSCVMHVKVCLNKIKMGENMIQNHSWTYILNLWNFSYRKVKPNAFKK